MLAKLMTCSKQEPRNGILKPEQRLKDLKQPRNEHPPFTPARICITDVEDIFHFDQDLYLSEIENPNNTEHSKYASIRIKLT